MKNPLTAEILLGLACLLGFGLADAQGQQVAATLSSGSLPYGVAVDANHGLLHVVNSGDNSVSTYNLVTRSLIHTTSVGSSPEGIAVGPTGVVYVASTFSNALSIINPSANYSVTTYSAGYHPMAIAVNPVNGKVYVADYGPPFQDSIYIFDPANHYSYVTVTPATPYPAGVAIDASTGNVYIISTNGSSGGATNATVIDPTTNNTTSVPVGRDASAVAVDPNSHVAYVANEIDNTVSIITPASGSYITSTLSVQNSPDGLAIDGSGNVYVSNDGSATVSVISPSSQYPVASVSVGKQPGAIAFDSGTNTVIVCNEASNSASIINPNTLSVSTLLVGRTPLAVATDASRGESYVANQSSGTVTVITD